MSNSTALNKRKYFSPADLIIVGFVLLAVFASLSLLYPREDSDKNCAQVRVGGELVETIDLSAVKNPYEFSVKDKDVVLWVSSEGIRFLHSDCHDKLCINRGLISKNGESAVCLPTGVSIKITQGTESPEIDAIVG